MTRQLEIARLSSKGQLVIPKKLREKLNWSAGEHVAVELKNDGLILRKLTLDDIIKESEEDWEKGDTTSLWPRQS